MDDSERLQWLEDQLWNGWELVCLMDRQPKPYQIALGGSVKDGEFFEADSLREVIDQADEAATPRADAPAERT